ncbi:hypothetical protein ACO2Q8_07595 [Larkinella sp. VNQ87]|uniref:hypothetical protein n=1 Tax=Larkinella sp. VNQ87 TaxID=3400921 RepID=UPI003C09BAC0
MKALLLISLVELLAGGDGERWQPRSEQARVIIYRQREFGGNSYSIKLNDKKLATLPTNRSLQVEVAPGRVKIESVRDFFSENQELWLNLQPGQTYYVKAVEEIDFLTRTLLMAPISKEQAERELQKVKPLEPISNHSGNE